MLSHARSRAIAMGFAFLLVLELGLRVAVDEERLLFSFEHPEGIIKLLGDRVWVRESSKQHGTDGPYRFDVVTNSLGLRDEEEHQASLAEGSDRYLALGDSWIFGTSVTQARTIPEQIEVELSERTGRPTSVLNAGIPGGSAFETLARWTELKDRFELTGIVLGIPHNVGRQRELASHRRMLFHPTQGAPYLNWRTYLLVRRALAPYTRPRYASSGSEGLRDDLGMLDDLRTIVVEARDRGLSVTIIEDPGHLNDAVGTVRKLERRWREELEPLGVVFAGHALNSRDCWGYEDLGHPGESGAKAIAIVVADAMVKGRSTDGLQVDPSCTSVPGVGPGKTEGASEF
jgi:hypothetical protein